MRVRNLHRILMLLLFSCLLLFASAHFKKVDAATGYGPAQIKAAYNLPATGGSGTVAIVLWGSSPTLESDLAMFDAEYNLPPCTQANGCLTMHYMGGVANLLGGGEVGEINMDTEWVHAIAPNAKILYVFAQSNQPQDMIDAIQYASQQPGVVAMSMSFGVPNADGQLSCSVFSNSSIAYFAATGDGGNDIEWPAVCPQVIAVGGTRLVMNGNSVMQETAWSCSYGEINPNTGGPSCTGGGLSKQVSQPSYQASFNIASANGFRGVPDVSAIADVAYGAVVVVQGSNQIHGGTSLATPIWAGISALNSTPITHESLYANAAAATYSNFFRDITVGDDGNCGAICTAGIGYDFVTGLGSPIALPGSSGSSNNPSTTPSPSVTTTPTAQSSQIMGEAYSDTNGNGKLDSGEPGYPGIDVAISGTKTSSTRTDSGGNYSFTNLSTGNYTLTAKLSGTDIIVPLSFAIPSDNSKVEVNIPVSSNQQANPSPVVVNPTIITPTPTATPTPDTGGGGGGNGGGFQPHGTPTPTPAQYFNCQPDPNCAKSGKSIQLCPLVCTPQ